MANWSTQTATRECQIASNGELTVVERLASLLQTGQFADVTIRVGEGKDAATFKAHRLLLATASQPLSNLVTSNLKNGPSGDIITLHVTDIDPETFQHVLRYIYTDDVKISGVGESLALLKMGKKWDLPKLVAKTIKYLEAFLSEYEPMTEDRKNELCDLIMISEEHGLKELTEKCWMVLVKNVNDVVPCQGFLNMTKDMVRRLLSHPDFHFKNQLVLFESIRDWGMNQVLMKNLSVNSLPALIGDFLQFVDFKAIDDVDFLDTILPSDVLGKGELIAFFMTRGLEIPRDLAYNNNLQDTKNPYEKTRRYKRGFKLPNQEIYKEHELRFRVDKKLRLLGVGFGFLFSNTDMGITVHCQGPWETRQWRDIIQTYCRVTWEKMKTADVRLMFSEPVTIEPNHSYKILVRVSRMSAGSHDVDLWGGAHGVSRIKMEDAEFSFLKAAIDPNKEVEEADMDNKPGMITDLFYELEDGTSVTRSLKDPTAYECANYDTSPSTPKKNNEETSISRNYNNEIITSNENSVTDEPSQNDTSYSNSYSYSNTEPSYKTDTEDYSPTQSSPKQKKSYADEAASYYLTTRPSNIRGSDTIPSFLKPRQPSVERSKPSWQIPYRTRATIPAAFSSRKSREPSANRESSTSRETNYISRRPSRKNSNLYDNLTLSKYNYGVSTIKSKFDTNSDTNSNRSRKGYESSSTVNPYSKWSTPSTTSRYGTSSSSTIPGSRYGTSSSKTAESRYGTSSSSTVPESRYGTSSSSTVPESRYGTSSSSTGTESRYGNTSRQLQRYTTNNSDTKFGTADTSYSRYGTGSASSRTGREKAPSPPSRTSTASPSLLRTAQTTAQTTDKEDQSRSLGTSSPVSTSRYSSSISALSTPRLSSRYGTSTIGTTGSSKYSSDIGRSSGTSGSTRASDRKETDTPSSTTTSSRYGTSSISNPTSSSLESRYSSLSSTTPSYLSSNRYGSKSSTGYSSRFSSSLYRR